MAGIKAAEGGRKQVEGRCFEGGMNRPADGMHELGVGWGKCLLWAPEGILVLFTDRRHEKRGAWKEGGEDQFGTRETRNGRVERVSRTEGSGAQHIPGCIVTAGTTATYLWVSDGHPWLCSRLTFGTL